MLHGWRLDDRKDMRMSGYASRVRSLGFTADGKWLAASGSTQVVLWPFGGKDGPMGKQPQLRAPSEQQAEVVACHPQAGRGGGRLHRRGWCCWCAPTTARRFFGQKKPGDAPVTALAWSASGKLLAFGTESGEAGVAGPCLR